MKISKSQLIEIIKEEITRTLKEGDNRGREKGKWRKGDNPSSGKKAKERDALDIAPYGKSAFEDDEEVGKDLTEEDKNWAKKAGEDVKANKKEGDFTKYCEDEGFDGVSQGCIDHTKKHGSAHRKEQALFAANISKGGVHWPKD